MSDFDRFAEDYETIHTRNIRSSGFDPSYFDEAKIREVHALLVKEKREKCKIDFLNFGCGVGKSERFIRRYLPRSAIFSIDVSQKSIEAAKERNKDLIGITFKPFDGIQVPFENSFDVIFIANVFHHVPFENHVPILEHLYRKLKDGGTLFLFEHNPLNPLTVRAVNTCEFDKDARLLNPLYANKVLKESGFARRNIRFVIFFPKFLSFLIPFEKYLKKLPLGAQYYFAARKRAASAS